MRNLKKRNINFAYRVLELCIKMQVKWLQLQHTPLNTHFFMLFIAHMTQNAYVNTWQFRMRHRFPFQIP